MTAEQVGLVMVAVGVVSFCAGTLLAYRRVRREVFTVLRHPSYSVTYNAGSAADDRSLTVFERARLHDWSEAGEL